MTVDAFSPELAEVPVIRRAYSDSELFELITTGIADGSFAHRGLGHRRTACVFAHSEGLRPGPGNT